MLDGLVILGCTVPIAAVALWKYRYDYRKHKRQTWLGLLAVSSLFFMPNLLLAWYKPWFTTPETPLQVVGTVTWIAGLTLTVISVVHFRKLAKVMGMDTSKLETRGIYRYSRNPQYVFWFLFVLGYAMTGRLWPGVMAVSALAVILHLVVLVEEEHLEDVYGEEYVRYRERAPRYLLFF